VATPIFSSNFVFTVVLVPKLPPMVMYVTALIDLHLTIALKHPVPTQPLLPAHAPPLAPAPAWAQCRATADHSP